MDKHLLIPLLQNLKEQNDEKGHFKKEDLLRAQMDVISKLFKNRILLLGSEVRLREEERRERERGISLTPLNPPPTLALCSARHALQVNDEVANVLVAQLLYLANNDPEADITLYINSPGGSVSAGMAIYDAMQVGFWWC